MNPDLFLVIVLLAVGIGALASLFGIGGGFLLLPTMILFVGMTTHHAVGTIPLVIIFMSLSSTIAYARQKRVDYLVTGIVASATVLGSIVGALITSFVAGKVILVLFGTVEAILATILGIVKTPAEKEHIELDAGKGRAYIMSRIHVDFTGKEYRYSANLLVAIPLSFLAGFLSSLLGIGGGTLYIQIFVFLCGMSIHMAIACSMASIFISAIASFGTYAMLGQVDYIVAIAYGIGMVVGAQIGAQINRRIHSRYLKPAAAIMIIIIAARMIIFALLES